MLKTLQFSSYEKIAGEGGMLTKEKTGGVGVFLQNFKAIGGLAAGGWVARY